MKNCLILQDMYTKKQQQKTTKYIHSQLQCVGAGTAVHEDVTVSLLVLV